MFRETNAQMQNALIGFLNIGPMHPYGLHAEIKRCLGSVWRIGLSHLYAYLKALETAGLVETQAEDQPKRPSRIVYRPTEAGRAAFLAWISEPSAHTRHIRLEFLVRLYLIQRLSLPGLPTLISGQKVTLASRLECLDRTLSETTDDYRRLVLDFRMAEISAIMSWLDRCEDRP